MRHEERSLGHPCKEGKTREAHLLAETSRVSVNGRKLVNRQNEVLVLPVFFGPINLQTCRLHCKK
jgi:hypothetical protein